MDGDLLPLLSLRAQIEGAVNAAAEHTLQIDVIARRWLRFLWMRFDACTPPRYSPTFTRVILLTVLHVSLHTVALITYSNGAIIAWRRGVLFEISLWALVNRRETKDVVGSHSTNKLIYKQEARKYIYIYRTLYFLFESVSWTFIYGPIRNQLFQKKKESYGRSNQFFCKLAEISSEFRRIYFQRRIFLAGSLTSLFDGNLNCL